VLSFAANRRTWTQGKNLLLSCFVATDPLLPFDSDDTRIDAERITELAVSFRDSKHYLLNSIAIWTAQAEMANRDSGYYHKLAESILERSERLVELVRDTETKLRMLSPHAVLPLK
jgi:hypothetical protein